MKRFNTHYSALFPLLPLTLAALITGCGGGSSSSNDFDTSSNNTDGAISAQYQGYWQAEGYGQAFKVDPQTIELYQYTSNYCFLTERFEEVTNQDLERALRLNNDNRLEWYSLTGDQTFGAPSRQFSPAANLPSACADGLESKLGDADYQDNSLYVFDVFREIFSEYYVDIERVADTWQSLADELRYLLPNKPTGEAAIDAMAQLLEPLQDTHNFIDLGNGQSLRTFTNPTFIQTLISEYAELAGWSLPFDSDLLSPMDIDNINHYIDSEVALTQAITYDYADQEDDIRHSDNGLITWFQNQGVGYINIAAMTGYGDPGAQDDLASTQSALVQIDTILDQVLTDLTDVSALVVDVRTNDGGNDYISLAIASRFTESPVHAYSKQARQGTGRSELQEVHINPRGDIRYTGPIYLLTSRNTVSAAEVFALAMTALPHVTLVGEPTQGAFSDVLEWTLPNGFEMGLSNEFYLTPNGQWLEGEGVPVDVFVPTYRLEARRQFQDEAIDTVLDLVANLI